MACAVLATHARTFMEAQCYNARQKVGGSIGLAHLKCFLPSLGMPA